MGVELRILGPIELADDSGAIDLPAPKHRRLLAALALARGRTCPVDELLDAVWGESPPPSARKLLQIYVSRLRKVLPPGAAVVTQGPGYALQLDAEAVDADRFERLLEDAAGALEAGNAALAASASERALALWRGPALADVAYDDFARPEAARLEELRLDALELRLDAQLRLGRDVLAEAVALAAQHPLRERLQALAMLALYRAGRQTEALDAYAATRARLHEELGLEPGADLRELQRRILQHDPALALEPGSEPARLLPMPPNPLVGRQRELETLHNLLGRRDVRLLVLTGAGGSGKTRLALEAAREAASGFANGAVLVELAPLGDPELVVPAVAHALELGDARADSPTALGEALREHELLLVLDNAEHVRDAASAFVELLARAPRVKLLVTSRVVLHVSGEHVVPVTPLPPDAAHELFRERARAADPSFDGTRSESAIAEICRRLDGLPLAIELAAAWSRVLPVGEILTRLAERLTLLTHGPSDLPARQQTLADTLAWSVGLLARESQRDFARLGIFAESWTLEAAEAVCDVGLGGLATLVDHSLVRVDTATGRYRMLETVREYALQLLGDDGELKGRHVRFYLELAERAEPELGGAEQGVWLQRLEGEHAELRRALERLAADGPAELELRLAAALGRFRYIRGYLAEARTALEAALTRGADAPSAARAKALRTASAICVLQGDYERGQRFAEEALVLYRELDDRAGIVRSLSNLGAILVARGSPAAAAAALEEAIELARALAERRPLALALNNLGDLALAQGRWDRAAELFDESLELLRLLGDEVNVARSLFNLGAAELERGRDEAAARLVLESLERSLELDDKEDIAWCLIAMAALLDRRGQSLPAAELVGASERLLEEIGASLKPYEAGLHGRTTAQLRARLADGELDAARQHGRTLPLAEAAARAGQAYRDASPGVHEEALT